MSTESCHDSEQCKNHISLQNVLYMCMYDFVQYVLVGTDDIINMALHCSHFHSSPYK